MLYMRRLNSLLMKMVIRFFKSVNYMIYMNIYYYEYNMLYGIV